MPYRDQGQRNDNARQAARRRRKSLLDRLGGVCAHCGFGDHRALEIDHVFNDGRQERVLMGRTKNADWLLKKYLDEGGDPSRLQVLCANCHRIKSWEERAPQDRS